MKNITTLIIAFLLVACAQIKSPVGGDVDQDAPNIVSSFPENYSTNYRGNEVVLTFDEYVVLKNLQAQMIISPPLNKPPQITLRKNRILSLKFEDDFENNTTYTINFGNGIEDLNEGNTLDSSSWVFSTGPELDAGEIGGVVKDEFTGKPCKACKIMLYANLSDTAIYQNKPYYYTLADDSGRFILKHLKEGTYNCFAFTDDNSNLTYQPGDEQIAFSKDAIQIKRDSTLMLSLNLFKEQKEKLYLSSSDIRESGKVQLRFSKSVEQLDLSPVKLTYDSLIQIWNKNKDTLDLWFINPFGDEARLALSSLEELKDSLSLIAFSRFEKPTERLKLEIDKYRITDHPIRVNTDVPIKLLMNEIEIFEDSIENKASVKADSMDPRIFYIEYPWVPEKKYQIQLLPEILEDAYSRTIDTILTEFKMGSLEDYGELTLNIDAPKNKYFLVFKGTKGEPGKAVSFEEKQKFVFKNLVPGNYVVKVVVDENQNQEWDPGSWLEKKPPEIVFVYPDIIQIRRNWQVELNWDLN